MVKVLKLVIAVVLSVISSFQLKAQTTLVPGDIVVLGINSDDAFPAQRWAFATMVPLQPETVIHFTDAGYLSTGAFYNNPSNEGHMTWTVPELIAAGTTFVVTNSPGNATIVNVASGGYGGVSGSVGGTGFGFTQTGDQIIVYQGTAGTTSGATFIYAFNNGQSPTNYPVSGSWMSSGAFEGQNLSYLPPGLTNGSSALAVTANNANGEASAAGFFGFDNMKYNNTLLTGTKTQLLGAIGSPLNWQGDNSVVYQLGSPTLFNFIVTGPASIATVNATNVTATGATMGGNIINGGNVPVTERGIVWAIFNNPTTANNRVTMGNGVGSYAQSFTGLPSNTLIYARAYAINNQGTSYGNTFTFTTLQSLPVVFDAINASINHDQVTLAWNTLSETNNDHFLVQVSGDGTNFSTVATVKSKADNGNSDTTLQYNLAFSLTDVPALLGMGMLSIFGLAAIGRRNRRVGILLSLIVGIALLQGCTKSSAGVSPTADKLFIRLLQVDKDGTSTNSKVLLVQRDK
jgi:hypothetical protein